MQDLQKIAEEFEACRNAQCQTKSIKNYLYPRYLWEQAILLNPKYSLPCIAKSLKISVASLSHYKRRFQNNAKQNGEQYFVKALIPTTPTVELIIEYRNKPSLNLKLQLAVPQLIQILQELT